MLDQETYSPTPRQALQIADYETIVETFGKFDQTAKADGSHYAPADKNPFAEQGLVCSNCYFYDGARNCEIVAGDIDPNAICKMWVIPENLVAASKKGDENMRVNFSMSITAADTQKRTISGRVVTWGEEGNTSAGKTVFAANSIEIGKNTKLLLEHDRTRPIGKLIAYDVTTEGIDATFKVANTMAGEDALVEASDGLRDGFSVGVAVDAWDNKKGVMEISAAKLIEISLVTDPAIASARVEKVSATETAVEETTEVSTETPKTEGDDLVSETVSEAVSTEAVEAAKSEVTAVTAAAPVTYARPRSPIIDSASYLEHTIKAAMGNDDSRQYVKFADDTTTNTGLTLPQHMTEFITTSIDGRPAVDAVSQGVLPSNGMSFTIPKLSTAPTVDSDSTETEALGGTSMASSYITVDVKKAAGMQTISWELLDRSSPLFYAELIKELNYAYAKATDTALVSALVAGGTQGSTQAATIAGLKAYIAKETPAAYKAAGKFAKNLIANTAWWETIIGAEDTTNRPLFIAAQPNNAPGSVSVNSLTGTVMGQNLFVDPHMSVTTLIDDSAFLVVPEAVTFYEAPKTTLQVQALANGQLQVAVYGYYGIATKVGAGIRRFNLT
jgi:HK97 family phage major capsid protein